MYFLKNYVFLDSAKATAVMSTNAAAFLLLTRHRDGCYLEELATELDQLRIELESDSRNLGFSGQSIDVLDYAVSI